MSFETAFTMDTSSIRYGPGVTSEVGYEMKRLGTNRVMVVTDPIRGTQVRGKVFEGPSETNNATPGRSV